MAARDLFAHAEFRRLADRDQIGSLAQTREGPSPTPPLNMRLLRDAAAKGLPVAELLGDGETLKAASVEFIDLRNRIGHGNLSGIIGFEHNGTPDYLAEAREAALCHMRKATAFVMASYNTSPDV